MDITVVIPTYNRAGLVCEAIASALAQEHVSVEVIVVDDGSTDNTREVVGRYDPQVRYLYQENRTEGPARNLGLQHSSSEFVAFLDSDDRWQPQKLARDLNCLRRNPEAGLVYSNARYCGPDGRLIGIRRTTSPSGEVLEQLVLENFIVLSTVTARRDVLNELGGFSEDRRLSGSTDWEMWTRIASRHKVTYRSETDTDILVHPANMMSNPGRMEQSMRAALECILSSAEVSSKTGHLKKRAVSRMLTFIATNYYATGEMKRAREFLKEAAQHDPTIRNDRRWRFTLLRTYAGRTLSRWARAAKYAGKRRRMR